VFKWFISPGISDKDTLVDSKADINDLIAASEMLQSRGESFVERVTGLAISEAPKILGVEGCYHTATNEPTRILS
jgi:hypothetical protein